MKTNKRYFAISETDNCNRNMGVCIASSYEELIEKIKILSGEHFDADVQYIDLLDGQYKDICDGGYVSVYVNIEQDGDCFKQYITVAETWVY